MNFMIEAIIVGFIAFFATGIDDTIAYTSLYAPLLKDRRSKVAISLGILVATVVALGIAYAVSSLIGQIDNRHLIGAGVLIGIGAITLLHSAHSWHHKKLGVFKMGGIREKVGLFTTSVLLCFCVGFAIFFATGLDDIIAYSSLMIAESTVGIAIGVILATFVAFVIANFLSHILERVKHPERVGGILLIIVGLLIGLKVL